MQETDTLSPKLTLASEVTAIDVDQPNIVPTISQEKVEKPVIKDEPKVEKKDSKKIEKRSKKRSKSKKSKKTVEHTVAKKAASSQMPETDITSPKLTLASEATAIDADQPNIVPPKTEKAVEKPMIKDERKGEKKDSKKIKKKSKKGSKSKKSKKTEKDTASNKALCSQMPETDITSPKLTLASEVTAIDADQPNIVPPIPEEAVEKQMIKDERKGEKKDSKKIKKKSKKRSKSKKSNKSVDDKALTCNVVGEIGTLFDYIFSRDLGKGAHFIVKLDNFSNSAIMEWFDSKFFPLPLK
ncbi:Zonadhesin [Trichinella spiralis]|uniref:Zonadhesin n=1 Tax=Trichinella spiralis TaxID=6334 RepID=A0ABR3L079_TRISP